MERLNQIVTSIQDSLKSFLDFETENIDSMFTENMNLKVLREGFKNLDLKSPQKEIYLFNNLKNHFHAGIILWNNGNQSEILGGFYRGQSFTAKDLCKKISWSPMAYRLKHWDKLPQEVKKMMLSFPKLFFVDSDLYFYRASNEIFYILSTQLPHPWQVVHTDAVARLLSQTL